METIDIRNMAGKPITATYKGILRISNNKDLIDNKADNFLNDEYYFTENSGAWFGDGVQLTHDFLSSDSAIKRFKSEDIFSDLKVPVTDSMGNFMNFYLGVDSSLIGSNSECGMIRPAAIQFDDNDTETLAAVSTGHHIIIGRTKQPNDGVNGANLNIVSSDAANAKIAVINDTLHDGNIIVNKDADENYRTIYDVSKTTPEKYDAFIYDQENYVSDEKNKDCIITLKNLRDYVYGEVNRYLENNSEQVPTGTIISQYCNLDKWFCWDKNKGVNDLDAWQGYRPAMYNSSNAPYSYYNTACNGKVLKTPSFLYFNDDTGAASAFTSELPPDFKRGYVLCNGDKLTIQLQPYWASGEDNAKKSLDLFLNLFYTIGYYYTLSEVPIHQCIKDSGGYDYNKGYNYWYVGANADREVAYGITMATLLAFKALDSKFNKGSNPFTSGDKVKECLNWLKKQVFDDAYVFNVIVPNSLASELPNAYYNYKDALGNLKNCVNIGREINSFADSIPYYSYNNGSYELVSCPITETAEIRDLVKLYINRYENQSNWQRYTYDFNIPRLYTHTDNDVNTAYSYNKNMQCEVSVGQFIGSNGLLISDGFENKLTNETVNIDKMSHSFCTTYNHSYGYNAHSHAIAKGYTALPGSNKMASIFYCPPAERTDPKGEHIVSLKTPVLKGKAANKIDNVLDVNVPAANYDKDFFTYVNHKSELSYYMFQNYVFQDVNDKTDNEIKYTDTSGTVGYETVNSLSDNFKWYGRCSEPIWTPHDISSTTSYTEKMNASVGYFMPESIKVMPLIKL